MRRLTNVSYVQENGQWKMSAKDEEDGEDVDVIVTDKSFIKKLNDFHRKEKLSKLLSE